MNRVSRSLAAVSIVLFVGVFAGCKPRKVGDKCVAGQDSCSDKSSALTCGSDGKFYAMSCRGPAGCVASGSEISCDDSIAQENDGCDEDQETACSGDKKSVVQCKDHKFAISETCKGTGGCTVKDDKITCDNDVSDIGDPCHFEGDYACTTDKTFVVKCVGSKMIKLNSCRGEKACRV